MPLPFSNQILRFNFEFWLCEIISGVTGQRHSATSVLVSSYLMLSKRTLGKKAEKLGLTVNVFMSVLNLSCRIMLVDNEAGLHKPLSTSTGMNHKCCNSSTIAKKICILTAFIHI